MTSKRFKDLYYTEVIDKLKQAYDYQNIHSIPKIKSIVLNMGVGKRAVEDSKSVDAAMKDLSLIAGQKPCFTKAKKSIAAFKLRKGMKIGCKVTLRGDRMYEFLERLIYTALPRVKDFKGFSIKNFDSFGNLNFGIKEQTVFPEIKYDEIFSLQGMNISIVINSNTSKESKLLLSSLNFPFVN
jgi:large subunit ribosomal protein L5